METKTTTGQAQNASQQKVIDLEQLKEEIAILECFGQSEGVTITNLLEMLDEQISIGIEKTEMLPEDRRQDDIMKTLFRMDTLLKIITDKVDGKLFWAIDNVVFELTKKDAK